MVALRLDVADVGLFVGTAAACCYALLYCMLFLLSLGLVRKKIQENRDILAVKLKLAVCCSGIFYPERVLSCVLSYYQSLVFVISSHHDRSKSD